MFRLPNLDLVKNCK